MKRQIGIYAVLLTALCLSVNAQEENNLTEKVSPAWIKGSYLGPISVSLKIPKGIKGRIETDDLILLSLTWDRLDDYLELFGDPATVEKYADGKPWAAEEVKQTMDTWIHRWESLDPFSAFAVYLKNETKLFIGHIVLGHGPQEGQAELGFLFKPEYQNLGYCKQAVAAIIYGYVPRLIKDGYLANVGSERCEPSLLNAVHATVRLDNPYPAQALRLAGMKPGAVETLWGDQRVHYTITAEEILNNKVLRDQCAASAKK